MHERPENPAPQMLKGLRERFEAHQEERQVRLNQPEKPKVSRFTTKAAIDWGKAQGWKLLDRERFDYRTNRHHDVMFATDCLFDDGGQGMVAIQGAGRYERAPHYERFLEAGGPASAKRLGFRVLYLEFVRGNDVPVVKEWWS